MTSPLTLNVPAGFKIFGANLVVRNNTQYTEWRKIWNNFGAAWPTEYRKQIDFAKGMGCNTVRVVGNLDWITTGAITSTQYYSYWNTLLAYLQARGMYCYPLPHGSDSGVIAGLSNSAFGTAVADWLDGIAAYNSIIIGVDLINEVNSWAGQTAAQIASNCATIYGVVKPRTSLPLTFSTYEHFSDTGSVYDSANTIIASVDFLDYHIYGGDGVDNTQAAVTAGPRARHPTYEVLIGEFGLNHTQPNGSIVLYDARTYATGQMADSKVRGTLIWGMVDQPGSQWGIFDDKYNVYDYMAYTMINALGTTAAPVKPLAAPINPHDGILVIDPTGCTTDFASVKWYRNGTLIGTTLLGYIDGMYGGPASYTAKISTVSNGDSVASDALVANSPAIRSGR